MWRFLFYFRTEFKAAFKKYDKGSTGTISVKDVSGLMKTTKHIQNDKEIQGVIAQAGVEGKRLFKLVFA